MKKFDKHRYIEMEWPSARGFNMQYLCSSKKYLCLSECVNQDSKKGGDENE